jgi:hypothetical protein
MKYAPFLALSLILLSCAYSIPQEPSKARAKPRLSKTKLDEIIKQSAEAAANEGPVPHSEADLATMPTEVRDAYLASRKAAYEYDKWTWEFTERIYRWQHVSGIIAFVVSVCIVIVGVAMSCLQFWTYYRTTTHKANIQKEAVEKTSDPETLKQLVSQLEVTMQGVKLSSPVLGVIILGLSLVFFYVYLKFVYPIQ